MNWPLALSLSSLVAIALVVALGVLAYLPMVSDRAIDAAIDAVPPVRDPGLPRAQRRIMTAMRAEEWLVANGRTPAVFDGQQLFERICARIDLRPNLLEP